MKPEMTLLAWADDVALPLARGTVPARIEIVRVTTRRRLRRPTVTFLATVRLPEGHSPGALVFACPTIPRAAAMATDVLDGRPPR